MILQVEYSSDEKQADASKSPQIYSRPIQNFDKLGDFLRDHRSRLFCLNPPNFEGLINLLRAFDYCFTHSHLLFIHLFSLGLCTTSSEHLTTFCTFPGYALLFKFNYKSGDIFSMSSHYTCLGDLFSSWPLRYFSGCVHERGALFGQFSVFY